MGLNSVSTISANSSAYNNQLDSANEPVNQNDQTIIAQAGAADLIRNEKVAEDHGGDYGNTRNDGKWHKVEINYLKKNGSGTEKKSEPAYIRFAGWDKNSKAKFELNALGKTFTVKTNSFSNAKAMLQTFVENQKGAVKHDKLESDRLNRNDGQWHDTTVSYHLNKDGSSSDNKSETVKIRFVGWDQNLLDRDKSVKARYEINALGKNFVVRTNSFSNAQAIAQKFVEDSKNGNPVSIPESNPQASSKQSTAPREKLEHDAFKRNDGQWYTQTVYNTALKIKGNTGDVSIRFKQWDQNGKAQYEIKGDGKLVVVNTNSFSKAIDMAQELVNAKKVTPRQSSLETMGPGIPDLNDPKIKAALKDNPKLYEAIKKGQYVIGIDKDTDPSGFKAGTLFAIADAATTVRAYRNQGANKTLAGLPHTMVKDMCLIPIINFKLDKVGVTDPALQALIKGGVGLLTSYGSVYVGQKLRGPYVIPRSDILHSAAIGNAFSPLLGVMLDKIREQHPDWAQVIGQSDSPPPKGWQEFLQQNVPESLAIGLGFSIPLTTGEAIHQWKQLTSFASLKDLKLQNLRGNNQILQTLIARFKHLPWKSMGRDGAETLVIMTGEALLGKALTSSGISPDGEAAVNVGRNVVGDSLLALIRSRRVEAARLSNNNAAPQVQIGKVLNRGQLAKSGANAVLLEGAFQIAGVLWNYRTIYKNDIFNMSRDDAKEALQAIDEVMASPVRWYGKLTNFIDIGTIGGTKFTNEMNQIKENIYNVYPELRPVK